jgi:HlyD family secretion protein
MNRKVLYTILGVVAVLIVVVAVVARSRQAALSQQDARTAVVRRGTMLVAVSASGVVEPRARINLTFESPGRVAQVLVDIEDPAEEGDVLARLDSAQLELQVQQAQAALDSARARLAQLEAGPRPEEIAAAEANLRAAQAQVTAADASFDQIARGATAAQIAAAEADLASAIAQQRSAEEAHDMTMKCFTFDWMGVERTICPALGVPEEQTRYSLEAANAGLEAAQAYYDEVLAGADADQLRAVEANVWTAAAQRDAAQVQLDLLMNGPTADQIAAAETQVAQAEAALEQANLALENSTLRAPFDGIVGAVNVTVGEMAPTGLPAIVFLDASEFRVTVSVDEMDVGRLIEGQEAVVTLDALSDAELTGVIERIAPAATLEGGVVYYEVLIALDSTDALIRADMTANATIIVEELTDVLIIPTWVVRVDRDTGQTYVDRQVGWETERVDVTLGIRHEGMVQVLNGLLEGDVVVWVESFRLRHP